MNSFFVSGHHRLAPTLANAAHLNSNASAMHVITNDMTCHGTMQTLVPSWKTFWIVAAW